jgi:NAD(P) transhydrogenase subunit beta
MYHARAFGRAQIRRASAPSGEGRRKQIALYDLGKDRLGAVRAQPAVRELAYMLEERPAKVRYAIHEAARRMFRHTGMLTAEAKVSDDHPFRREDIEADFENLDVAMLIGANELMPPSTLEDEHWLPCGVPILLAHQAQQAFVIKRSLAAGSADLENTLFESDRTMMVFGSSRELATRSPSS